MKIPGLILRQLYTFGSLKNTSDGVRLGIKNRLADSTLTRIRGLRIGAQQIPVGDLRVQSSDGRTISALEITPQTPLRFALRDVLHINARCTPLPKGSHELAFSFDSDDLGELSFSVKDAVDEVPAQRNPVPLDKEHNYTPEIIRARQQWVEERTSTSPQHLWKYSFDPSVTRGNIENFIGVAQVPIGLAGPLLINGEHAIGEFVIPMATTEGTLVASYNRGMKVLNLSGGVTCTVSADCMQRAPVFVFDSARQARDFRDWVDAHIPEIRDAAEATSHVAKLLNIDTYLSNKFAYLRFNFSTGDAAGQNMVGRATFAACSWISEQVHDIRKFYLESNLATDKKASHVNVMRTRGKRVTAEAVVPRSILADHMRVDPESLRDHSQIGTIGAFLSGANNNGAHSPNGITAMFIATGQDVANVAESSAAILHSELTPEGDLYVSITIPSLIVATHGGGTGLPTQRECLQILGCTEPGSVLKFAEIVAGVVLAGELSLGAAISSLDWVSSHEKYGRNR